MNEPQVIDALDFMDNPSNDLEESLGNAEPEAAAETPAAAEEPAEPVKTEAEPVKAEPDLDALIKQYAKEEGLDPAKTADLRILRRLAEKELVIRRSKGGESSLNSKVDAMFGPKDDSTEAGRPPEEKAAPAEESQADPDPVLALADGFKSTLDAEKNYLSLVGDANATDEQIAQAGDAVFVYRLRQAAPALQNMFEQMMESRLGPVMGQLTPVLEQSRNQAMERDRDSVVTGLKSLPEFEGFDDIFTATGEGKIEIDGQQFPNTPMNQIIRDFPMILNIKSEDKRLTPEQNRQKTLAQRYTAVFQIHKRQKPSIDPATRAGLVELGQAQERSKADPVRHSLNSGKAGVPAGTTKGDDFSSLFGNDSGHVSMKSLFK